MVILHVKKRIENCFLFAATVDAKVEDVIRDITIIHNGRLKVLRICYEMEELANHGVSLPLNMQGLNEDQWQDLHLKDEWGDVCIPSGGWQSNKDIMVRRNGRQPKEKMQELIKKSIEDAKDMISRKLIEQGKFLTQKIIQDALDILKGTVMIVYPMGLPPYDPIRLELENKEDLAGTHASLEVIDMSIAQLWFAGKELIRGHPLKDFIGKNEKTKIIVQLTKKGDAGPMREPIMSDEERKILMAEAYRRREQEVELIEAMNEEI